MSVCYVCVCVCVSVCVCSSEGPGRVPDFQGFCGGRSYFLLLPVPTLKGRVCERTTSSICADSQHGMKHELPVTQMCECVCESDCVRVIV